MSLKAKFKWTSFVLVPYFLLYFVLQTLITTSNYSPLFFLDEWIPFNPHFIWIYHSIIPMFALISFSLLKTDYNFISMLASYSIAGAALITLYILFPAFYPRFDLDPNNLKNLSEMLVYLTYRIDAAQNTFPSNHVTFAWIMVFWAFKTNTIKQSFLLKSLFGLWYFGVCLSTLMLKQHFIFDVITGTLMGATATYVTSAFLYSYIKDYLDSIAMGLEKHQIAD